MPKILILENEELFRAIRQVDGLLRGCDIVYAADINGAIPDGEEIIIGSLENLRKIKAAKAFFIGLSENNENLKNDDLPNEINIIKKPYRVSQVIDIIQYIIMNGEIVTIGGFEFNISSRALEKKGVKVNLTEKEAQLVALLNSANGEVVGRDAILKQVWGYDEGIETHTVETHIYRIRQKLGADSDLIGNSGDGYFICNLPKKA
jgi:hypothetical protein